MATHVVCKWQLLLSSCLYSHAMFLFSSALQETVKGSQGAGKVDEALDRGAKAERGEEPEKAKGPAKPNLPARAGSKGKGGRR